MSNSKPTVDGIPCSPQRTNRNGIYHVYFDRKDATLDQIERIDWAHPTLENTGDELPSNYGYQIDDIAYLHPYRRFAVRLKVLRQYLGDVTGYQVQVEALEASLATAQEEKAAAQAQAQTAEEEAAAAQAAALEAQEQAQQAQAQAAETAEILDIIVSGEEAEV